ncbi:hypothetical protein BG006_005993 [Podila minutissima]|uniref:G domain-containing protein n=1 Tax=Podila minutissima TaxID=64525 RepID=A0A9P5SJC8_9FUNG|nr:hypothetical protein BG006_005993 [Podila minutissima]
MTQTTSFEWPRLAGTSAACNVILIGETQAGKSTFVEAIRKYPNSDHTIDKTKIGTGTMSFTKEVTRTRVTTSLLSYNVIEEPGRVPIGAYPPPPKAINTDALVDEEENWQDYEERINKRNGLTLEQVPPHPRILYQFDLFDTPGLNDTNGEDEVHINTIFQALKCLDKIHLVLVMVGPNPFTSGFKTALKCYMDVFPEFQGVIAFVHNKPVIINKLSLHKTPKMIAMDRIIVNKYSAMIEAIVMTLSTKNVLQGSILQQVYERKTKLNTLRAEKRDGEDFIAEYDTDKLVMIYESRFDEQWRLFHVNRPHHMSLPSQGHMIHRVALLREATEVLTQKGGKGDTVWEIEFQRKSFKDGVLHAKLYTTSADRYRLGVSTRKTRAVCLQGDIPEAEGWLSKHNEMHASQQQEIDDLVEQNRWYTELLSLAKKDRLDPKVFEQLVEHKAYTGEAVENAVRVEDMYLQVVQ